MAVPLLTQAIYVMSLTLMALVNLVKVAALLSFSEILPERLCTLGTTSLASSCQGIK